MPTFWADMYIDLRVGIASSQIMSTFRAEMYMVDLRRILRRHFEQHWISEIMPAFWAKLDSVIYIVKRYRTNFVPILSILGYRKLYRHLETAHIIAYPRFCPHSEHNWIISYLTLCRHFEHHGIGIIVNCDRNRYCKIWNILSRVKHHDSWHATFRLRAINSDMQVCLLWHACVLLRIFMCIGNIHGLPVTE